MTPSKAKNTYDTLRGEALLEGMGFTFSNDLQSFHKSNLLSRAIKSVIANTAARVSMAKRGEFLLVRETRCIFVGERKLYSD